MSIAKLLDKLRETGIDLMGDAPIVASISRDLKIVHSPSSGPRLFLRILDKEKAIRDFGTMQFLKQHLDVHISTPERTIETDKLSCGIFLYIEHRKVSRLELSTVNFIHQAREALLLLHDAGREASGCTRQTNMPDALSTLQDKGLLSPRVQKYFTGTFKSILDRHPEIPQHSDFTHPNLGIDTAGQLLVFDCEDFGLARYAGFDAATFVLSQLYHLTGSDDEIRSPERLRLNVDDLLGTEVLEHIGISHDEFLSLFPGYLATFLAIKQEGYGSKINQRLHSILNCIFESKSWSTQIGPPWY